jgi:hypothetical protein
MTQDPYGTPPGSGYVVRGEVVPDDEADGAPPTAPMTHFQRVASALRGDRTDPAMADRAPSDQGAEPADPQSPDPDGTWPGTNQAAVTASPDAQDAPDLQDEAGDEAGRDATRPEEVVAVRRPDDGTRDYWDDTDETGPEEAAAAAAPDEAAVGAGADAAAQDLTTTQPDLYGTTARTQTDAATAGTAAPATAAEAAGLSAVEPEPVGRHASVPVQEGFPVQEGAQVQEGLRPGESESALGDFNDLIYGSLLPDAAEFKARWQQVQFRFVDDPAGSVTEAADVIAQVTAELEAAIQERQRAISARQHALRDRWSEGKSSDTESLRETLLMYRAFLDQLTGPKAG